MPGPITIRDIADKLGISKSTVQRALAGQSGVSAKTARDIRDTAEALGYKPDLLFASLALRRTHARQGWMEIAYLRSMSMKVGTHSIPALQEACSPLGYRVSLVDPDTFGAGKRLMEVLGHRGNVGVIVGPVRDDHHGAILNNTRLPVVCCGRINRLPLHTVRPDVAEDLRLAWRKLRAAGYRRIGPAIRVHTPALADDQDRFGALTACQLEIPEKDRIPPLLAPIAEKEALVEWYERHRPDAVIGFSIIDYYALKEGGVDMSRLGFVSLHVVSKADQFMSGIIEANTQVAHESVHLLDGFIRRRVLGAPDKPLNLLVSGDWNDGDTLPGVGR